MLDKLTGSWQSENRFNLSVSLLFIVAASYNSSWWKGENNRILESIQQTQWSLVLGGCAGLRFVVWMWNTDNKHCPSNHLAVKSQHCFKVIGLISHFCIRKQLSVLIKLVDNCNKTKQNRIYFVNSNTTSLLRLVISDMFISSLLKVSMNRLLCRVLRNTIKHLLWKEYVMPIHIYLHTFSWFLYRQYFLQCIRLNKHI